MRTSAGRPVRSVAAGGKCEWRFVGGRDKRWREGGLPGGDRSRPEESERMRKSELAEQRRPIESVAAGGDVNGGRDKEKEREGGLPGGDRSMPEESERMRKSELAEQPSTNQKCGIQESREAVGGGRDPSRNTIGGKRVGRWVDHRRREGSGPGTIERPSTNQSVPWRIHAAFEGGGSVRERPDKRKKHVGKGFNSPCARIS